MKNLPIFEEYINEATAVDKALIVAKEFLNAVESEFNTKATESQMLKMAPKGFEIRVVIADKGNKMDEFAKSYTTSHKDDVKGVPLQFKISAEIPGRNQLWPSDNKKYFDIVESTVNEMNINDPVLIAIRASKDDRKKSAEAQKERMKKRVYGKKREALEDQLWAISRDLKDAYAERRNIYDDMEFDAGQKGNEWSDDDANRYGSRLNLVDAEIEDLLTKRQAIELKLSY